MKSIIFIFAFLTKYTRGDGCPIGGKTTKDNLSNYFTNQISGGFLAPSIFLEPAI